MMQRVGERLGCLSSLVLMVSRGGRGSIWSCQVQVVRLCLSVKDRWVFIPSRQGVFSIASGWEAIPPRSVQVHWAGLLQGRRNTPGNPFVPFWLKDRLGTQDRLSMWDSLVLSFCILCLRGFESHDHLFFSYPFGCDIQHCVIQVMTYSHKVGRWDIELPQVCYQGIGKGVGVLCGVFFSVLRSILSSMSITVISMVVKLLSPLSFFRLF